MKIYTRTGDKGQTSLIDGTRVLKSNDRVESYGTIDELNSAIGLAFAFIPSSKYKDIKKELTRIQHELFEIGSTLSTPNAAPIPGLAKRPLEFEKLIDTYTDNLPPLKNFILPGGSKAGAQVHICRTLARRAERRVVALMQQEDIDIQIMIYLNRLSDLFFTLSRYINYKEKKKETKWIKNNS
jgi:cob(I)alamin adenosyltransferase